MVMHGSVDARAHEASLLLQVRGQSGARSEVSATVDTGFTGGLCLPPDLVKFLSLPLIGRGVAVLADGNAVETRIYRARVTWHNRERVTRVLATDGGVLIGMSLLRNSKLAIEVVPNGEVTIEERPS